MNKLIQILVALICFICPENSFSEPQQNFSDNKIFAQIEFDGLSNFKIPVLIATSSKDDSFNDIVKKIVKNIGMSGQFDVKVKDQEFPKKKSDIKNLSDQGFYLVVFLEQSLDKNFIEFRIYDSALGDMIKGKKIEINNNVADTISNHIWFELSGEQSVFGTKIAYVKRLSNSRNLHKSVICLSDLNGQNEVKIVKSSTINIKPQFVKTKNNLKLFYSEFTAGNVRLMSVKTDGSCKRPVFDFDGTIVGISLSADGQEATYCRSGNIWHYSYDSVTKKSVHRKIVYNFGNCCCPNLLFNGDIVFSSDFGGSGCCIYKARLNKNSLSLESSPEKLNIQGYCVSPSWCPVNNKIVYSKKLNSIMQLFIYDLNNYKEEQITFGPGNKIDACWSPCGNYLLFCYQNNKISRIARVHTILKEINFVTSETDFCSYPSWSIN